ncbi:MAG: SDR family oxidoreductase [Bacillota bacterium]|nr:SDR family oxidoreductase [Bacillota bacterium]
MPTPTTYKNEAPATPKDFPAQHQNTQPGSEQQMNPKPIVDNPLYNGSNKLKDKVAVIAGGDSGIGQATAIAFAKEGANVVIIDIKNGSDAGETKNLVEKYNRKCVVMSCDLKDERSAVNTVTQIMQRMGKIDILVNNVAVQYPQNSIKDITDAQLGLTFSTNVFSYFFMTKACLPHMQQGASIINTTSATAYKGDKTLIDYSSTKGAIVSFTRSLSQSLASKGIRVNAVAPGPVWTPLIPSSFTAAEVAQFGKDTPLGRAAQPFELAPTYVYLASDDSAYMTGQVLHVNGGIITES